MNEKRDQQWYNLGVESKQIPKEGLIMSIIDTYSLDSNRKNKLNFGGGELSSDAGILLIKEFVAKVGFDKLLHRMFKTTDNAVFRIHKDSENLMQMVYQIIASYFEDNCADEIKNDPIFTAALEKGTLAPQPTLSRFFNRLDASTLTQFDDIDTSMRNVIYSMGYRALYNASGRFSVFVYDIQIFFHCYAPEM